MGSLRESQPRKGLMTFAPDPRAENGRQQKRSNSLHELQPLEGSGTMTSATHHRPKNHGDRRKQRHETKPVQYTDKRFMHSRG